MYSYFPIDKASKRMPEWWKELPSSIITEPNSLSEVGSMKSCPGFTYYYNNAISLPLWSDVSIRTNEDADYIEWNFADKTSHAIPHDSRQKGTYLNNGLGKYAHLKLISPWLFRCKEEIPFIFTGNTWALDNPEKIIIPPGVVNYKYQNITNINLFLKVEGIQVAKLSADTSLVHIFPMSERDLEIKNHLISESEYKNLESLGITNFATKSYFKHKSISKEQEKAGKCPVSSLFGR